MSSGARSPSSCSESPPLRWRGNSSCHPAGNWSAPATVRPLISRPKTRWRPSGDARGRARQLFAGAQPCLDRRRDIDQDLL